LPGRSYACGLHDPHAYFSSPGSFTTLDPPGDLRSQGGFINAQGQVVGTYRDQNSKRHGFIWRNGVFTNLQINVPGDHPLLGTVALGINDPGQVVGDYVDATTGVRHGFLLSQGVYKALDPPGSSLTVVEGINDAGVIVGFYRDAVRKEHGFVLSQGVYTTIDVPNSTRTDVFSINARGQIVGNYDDANGVTHGFVGGRLRLSGDGHQVNRARRHLRGAMEVNPRSKVRTWLLKTLLI
jgi:probable HAF family extracellular repeat protein